MVMFGYELQRRLTAEGVKTVIVQSLHPGMILCKISHGMYGWHVKVLTRTFPRVRSRIRVSAARGIRGQGFHQAGLGRLLRALLWQHYPDG